MIASGDSEYAAKIRDYFITQQESAGQLSEGVAALCIKAIAEAEREDTLLEPAKSKEVFVTDEKPDRN